MPQADLLAVKGLETTSGAFRARLCEIADELGLVADYLAAVISFETAGTFRPDIENPYSHFVGLIQFGPAAAAEQGTSLAELKAMSDLEQIEYVRGFYAARLRELGPLETVGQHYLAVFSPKWAKSPPGTVMYARGSKAYEQNAHLDTDDTGTITVGEVTAIMRGIVAAAAKRPRLPIDEGPAGAMPVSSSSAGGVVLLGLLGLLGARALLGGPL